MRRVFGEFQPATSSAGVLHRDILDVDQMITLLWTSTRLELYAETLVLHEGDEDAGNSVLHVRVRVL